MLKLPFPTPDHLLRARMSDNVLFQNLVEEVRAIAPTLPIPDLRNVVESPAFSYFLYFGASFFGTSCSFGEEDSGLICYQGKSLLSFLGTHLFFLIPLLTNYDSIFSELANLDFALSLLFFERFRTLSILDWVLGKKFAILEPKKKKSKEVALMLKVGALFLIGKSILKTYRKLSPRKTRKKIESGILNGCLPPPKNSSLCRICFDSAENLTATTCGHLFCWDCIFDWLSQSSKTQFCPLCRFPCDVSSLVRVFHFSCLQENEWNRPIFVNRGDALPLPPSS